MGRSPCCSKDEGLNRGAWTDLEDKVLTDYIKIHGEGRWRDLPKKSGLKRCGKSCRLRWLNYLRPDIKRGNITQEEEDLIVRLHKLLGNRWSLIAGRLPARTDNEIKNYWNTTLSKKLNGTWVQKHSNRSEDKKKRRKKKNKSSNDNRNNNDKKRNKKPENGTLQTEAPLMTQRLELQGEKKKKKNSNSTNKKMKQQPITKTLSIEASSTQTMEYPQVVRPTASKCNRVILSLESLQDTRATLEHFISGDCVTDNTIQSEPIHDGKSSFMFSIPGQINPSDLTIDLNQSDLDLPDINSNFFDILEFQNGEGEECNGKNNELLLSREQTLLCHDELLEDLVGL
ncbi:hypothetical protein NE237_004078 [Protea cynaroides]|uniref:Uncharacterized protein n=1 Tax=Protea cynaroides TaxID=273540 RepID=A0A9Q0QTB6_9MAGN|nr:hypothetical protein NE237_004078 [Protea cynaroides]